MIRYSVITAKRTVDILSPPDNPSLRFPDFSHVWTSSENSDAAFTNWGHNYRLGLGSRNL